MIQFNAEHMSEDEFLKAANEIFKANEEDFLKFKSEKWYSTFFHAITINYDKKDYAVKGIKSLAKLQQLAMRIYVENYRHTHEKLDEIINTAIIQNKALKALYGICVLGFKGQDELEKLDEYDAQILALFLGEYRDEKGNIPTRVQDYNRGVLLALHIEMPIGSLENHQIGTLHNPEIVFRCFMEQTAVAETIDSQLWSSNIKEDLKDFELSENKKAQIRESVKKEAEIAGTEYFIIKYTNNYSEVIDADFVFDLEEIEEKIRKEKIAQQTSKIKSFLGQFISEFLNRYKGAIYNKKTGSYFEDKIVAVNVISKKEIIEGISIPFLIDSIKRTYESIDITVSIKFDSNNEANKENHYFFIATLDGFFFFVGKRIAFIGFESLEKVRQENNGLFITANKVRWFSMDGTEGIGDNEVFIEQNTENRIYLKTLRKGIEKLITEFGGHIESVEKKIEVIISKYINKIPNGIGCVPYLVKDFHGDNTKIKKMKNALTEYALKVRSDEVIGFLDTSLFGGGGDGILFSTQGIAFNYAFENVFIKYEEIEKMEINDGGFLSFGGKELRLYGNFNERKSNIGIPSINSTFYNLPILKICLEEINNVI